MRHIILSRRYAVAAILSLKTEQHQSILSQLRELKAIISDNPKVYEIFVSPIISLQKKCEVVASMTDHLPDKTYWQSLFRIILSNHRGEILHDFIVEFEEMLHDKLKQKHVYITLAHPQDDSTVSLIKSEVERCFAHKIIYDIIIDKDIIGGFVATTDSQMIDASIRSNLLRFAKSFTKK
jgi:ATP synthase F1 delta subunit